MPHKAWTRWAEKVSSPSSAAGGVPFGFIVSVGLHQDADVKVLMQGEMINEAGTLTGGGGKPRGGRMCLGSAAPRSIDSREAASELANAEQQLEQHMQVQHPTIEEP